MIEGNNVNPIASVVYCVLFFDVVVMCFVVAVVNVYAKQYEYRHMLKHVSEVISKLSLL